MLGGRFENVVSRAGENNMRGIWVFRGGIENRVWRCGGVICIIMLGGKCRISDCDRGIRRGIQ